MAVLWLLVRVRWRRALGPSLAVALLIGLVGGFALASAVSARGVKNSYRVLIDEIDAPDLGVILAGDCVLVNGTLDTTTVPLTAGCSSATTPTAGDELERQLNDSSVVTKVRVVRPVRPFLLDSDGAPLLASPDNENGCFDGDRSVQMTARQEGGAGDQAPPFRLEGELPVRSGAGIVLTRATAERTGLGIGETVHLAGWCNANGQPVRLSSPIDLRVTGLSVGPLDVEPPGVGLAIEIATVDPNVYAALVNEGAAPDAMGLAWLDQDASRERVADELAEFQIILDFRDRVRLFDDALAPDANLLWVLTLIGALAGLLVLTPVIARTVNDAGPDTATLAAIGTRRAQVAQHAALYAASLAAIGAVVAAILAIPLSVLMPRGLAAAIDPNRAVWFDAALTAVAVTLVFGTVLTIGGFCAWRIAAPKRSAGVHVSNPGALVVGAMRLRPASRTGVLAALGTPAGPRRASPWPSLISMVVVTAAAGASTTYLASLRHLETTPPLIGWNWDAVVYFEEDQANDVPRIAADVERIPGVERVTPGLGYPPSFLFVPDNGLFVWPFSFATGPDAITPTMLHGRAPDGPDEVAIDPVFAEQTGLGIGDTVELARPTLTVRIAQDMEYLIEQSGVDYAAPSVPEQDPVVGTFEITGIAVLPLERSLGLALASLTLDGFAKLVEPDASEVAVASEWLPADLPPALRREIEQSYSNFEVESRAIYIRFSGDMEATSRAVNAVVGVHQVLVPPPDRVLSTVVGLNLERADRVPNALMIMAAVGFVAIVGYLLLFSVRARRFELAVLRAIGLSTRDIRWSIGAQATGSAVVALFVGIPVGVLAGRAAWLAYANDLDVLPVSVVGWSALAIAAVGSILIANLAAMLFGWRAAKRTSVGLRSE